MRSAAMNQIPLPGSFAFRSVCLLYGTLVGLALGMSPAAARAACPVQYEQLLSALKASVKASGGPGNGGFDTHEWAAIVARDGNICAIAYSGPTVDAQWP